MEKVEEVARAMCESDGAKWDAASCHETANGEEPEEQRAYWMDKARAAIEAMRVPTPGMIDAAYAAHDAYEESAEPGAWCGLYSAYDAMIDAAMKEGE